MGASTAKIIERVFGDELVRFEADNIALRQTRIRSMSGADSNRNNATKWYPKPAIGASTDGLDLSGKFQSFTNLSIPEVVDTYTNYEFSLTNTDTLDEFELQEQIQAGMRTINARVNRAVANVVYQQGAMAVTTSNGGLGGTPITFTDVAEINSNYVRNDIDSTTQKTLIMNTTDYNKAAADLALRETLNKGTIPEGAYRDAFVAKIASLKVFETSFTPNVLAQGASITVNGAAQNVVPSAFQLTSLGSVENLDNRAQTLIVSATAGIVAGDKFTLADVFEVSMQNKGVTPALRTFTVKEVVDGTTLSISPQIVVDPGTLTSSDDKAQADYANCSVAPANASAITFLNLSATSSNLFWENESIVLAVAPVVGSQETLGGIILQNMTTGNGVGLNFVLAKQGNIDDFTSKWRMTTRFGANNREPEKNGTFLTNQ